ncbi:Pentatricopeptide repeat-containing protein At2g22410, mitochondrial [Linum perenne]
MDSCTSMLQLKQIQALMTTTSLITHTFPVSRALAFCALDDAGDINHARALFIKVQKPNTYMWNTMIRGYSKGKIPGIGFSIFCRMLLEQAEMDDRSLASTLKVCEQFSMAFQGQSVHAVAWKTGFSGSLLVGNVLIHFYGARRLLESSAKVFDEIPVKDAVSWTSMIDVYSASNCCSDALKLFDCMLAAGVEPNEITMIAVLSACSQKGDLEMGERIHAYITGKCMNFTLKLKNAILNMYIKCGCMVDAKEFFGKMVVKDVFSWTSMVNGYAKCGEIESARKLFNEMPKRNVVSWNTMIAGYSQSNHPKEALDLFHGMVEAGLVPTEDTLVCVLSACGQLGSVDVAQWIHLHYIGKKLIKSSVIISNAFIDMYAKCGQIDAAANIFHSMTERDVVSWNTIIAAYAAHGDPKQALCLFHQMQLSNFKPDCITFVGVLSACSHGGLVSEGREYFHIMETDFDIEPKREHYACMIDLLGRAGLLEDAYKLISSMPMQPSEAGWGALLNACRMHGNVELAKLSADRLVELDPEDSGIYVLLATVCARDKRWADVSMVRNMMKEKGVKKTPGRSLIEIGGDFHEFLAGDTSHPESDGIRQALKDMFMLSKMEDSIDSDVLELAEQLVYVMCHLKHGVDGDHDFLGVDSFNLSYI